MLQKQGACTPSCTHSAWHFSYLAYATLYLYFASACSDGLRTAGGAEALTGHYVMLLGLYRLFYLFNWIYRYSTEENYMQLIVWVAGIVQTALYLDFFYNYVNAKQKGIDAPIELPA